MKQVVMSEAYYSRGGEEHHGVRGAGTARRRDPRALARVSGFSTLLLGAILGCSVTAAETVWLDSMDLTHMRQSYGMPKINKSMRDTPLALRGVKPERGVGTHASSTFWVEVGGQAERFQSTVGVDEAAGARGSVVFKVLGDGRTLFDSGKMKAADQPKRVDVDLRGIKLVLLKVDDAGDGIDSDHGDWADAKFIMTAGQPRPVAAPTEEAIVLTPKPGPAPRLNNALVYGCRPGHPFIYRIPVQGARPLKFEARGLPQSLTLDADTGILTGTAPSAGGYSVILTARNSHGKASKSFQIISGEKLALTPPMGWNHWYAHYDRVTDKMMREAADTMVSSGMADVGYDYVNIDDCWMNAPKQKDPLRVGPLRDEAGNLIPNKHFPDMHALTRYIHSKGLKAGIYISPGPFTCAGFAGSFKHEAQDARQFAEWGFDFLKYDWCSYGDIAQGKDPTATNYPSWGKGKPTLEGNVYPYRLMGNLLKEQNRDIVYNLCQYGMADVWEWGEAVGAQCWRTAGDLGFELDRIFEVALKNAEHRKWSRPGAWNDPDYLQIGWVGNARGGGEPRPCPITPNEQYAYMSLWCLMAAPLVYSGDMSRLDEFTLNVLCNPEVIEIDQDPLGQSAAVSMLDEATFVMVKDMADGSKAVGLFNRGEFPARVAAHWPIAGVTGRQRARDLWRQKDLGTFDGKVEAEVPRHGVALFRLWSVNPKKS